MGGYFPSVHLELKKTPDTKKPKLRENKRKFLEQVMVACIATGHDSITMHICVHCWTIHRYLLNQKWTTRTIRWTLSECQMLHLFNTVNGVTLRLVNLLGLWLLNCYIFRGLQCVKFTITPGNVEDWLWL